MKEEIIEIKPILLYGYLKRSLARDRELYELTKQTMPINEQIQFDLEITHAETIMLTLQLHMARKIDDDDD